MENSSVFDYSDFRKYLSVRFSTTGNSRGMRIQFSKLVKASPSYVSKLISGNIRLSLEYVPILNKLMQHSPQESDYFMHMVLYTQAGSKDLELYFKEKLEMILEQRRLSAPWISKPQTLSENAQAKYTSHWFFAVIHVLTNLSKYRTKSALAARLHLSLPTVTQALDYLVSVDLVELKGDRYHATTKRIHIKKNSDWIFHYHNNIRQYAIQKLADPAPEDLHYSMIMPLSTENQEWFKKKIMALLKELEPRIQEQKPEEVFIYAIDLFKA